MNNLLLYPTAICRKLKSINLHQTTLSLVLLSLLFSINTYANSDFRMPNAYENMFGEVMMGCAFQQTYQLNSLDASSFNTTTTISETNSGYDIRFEQKISETSFVASTITTDLEGNELSTSNDVSSSFLPIPGTTFNYLVESSGGTSITMRRTSYPSGNVTWTRNYTLASGVSVSNLLATRAGNRILITGTVFRGNAIPVLFFVVTNLNGDQINQHISTEEGQHFPDVRGVERTPDFGFIISWREFTLRRQGITKLSSNGTLQYKTTTFFGNGPFFQNIALDNSGYYAGFSERGGFDARIRKLNINTGQEVWALDLRTSLFPNLTIISQDLQGMQPTADGGVIFGFRFNQRDENTGQNSLRNFVVKLDTNGNRVWAREVDRDDPVSQLTEDGGFFTVGVDFNSMELIVTRYNSEGLRLPACGNDGGGTGGGGCNVSVTAISGGVRITGLTSANNTKLFNSSVSSVWECNPWQNNPCSNLETVTGLPSGQYFLSVQLGGCDEWIPVTVSGNGGGGGCTDSDGDGVCNEDDCLPNDPARPATVGSACNDGNNNTTNDRIQSDGCTCAGTPVQAGCNVSVTAISGGVRITGLTSANNTKLFNASVSSVWECNPWQGNPCSNLETVTGLPSGQYFLSVQRGGCEEWIPVTVSGGGGCSDVDNDGVCDNEDCAPNNPSLPATPGTSCNDFNSNTDNDVIQSDGCACAGTQVQTGCNVSVTAISGGVRITGLTSANNTKLFNSNTSSVWECNPWQGNPCSGTETVTGLSAGQYFLSVQRGGCDEWIPVTVSGSGGGGTNRPDLSVSNLNISGGSPGQVVNFTFNLRNTGNATASGSYFIRSYISTNAFLGSSDIQEGTIGTGNTGVGTTSVTGAITVPNLSSGTYYLILVADDGNAIAESNENNNRTTSTFTIANGMGSGNTNIQAFNSPNTSNEALTSKFSVQDLFPNPTSGEVIAKIDSQFDGAITVQVTNMMGQMVKEEKITVTDGNNSFMLNMDSYKAGIYQVNFSDGNKVISQRVVKM